MRVDLDGLRLELGRYISEALVCSPWCRRPTRARATQSSLELQEPKVGEEEGQLAALGVAKTKRSFRAFVGLLNSSGQAEAQRLSLLPVAAAAAAAATNTLPCSYFGSSGSLWRRRDA